MSMSAGQPGVAKLQSQLSMMATPADTPSKHHRSSLAVSAVVPPLATTDRRSATPSPRPAIRRQAAVCPSDVSDQQGSPAPSLEPVSARDGHVTVLSF